MNLNAGEVHLWRGTLDDRRQQAAVEGFLDAGEMARARRFHFERDRCRFIVARGLLRVLLGRYLRVDPGGLAFGYTERGKPFLDEPSTALRFNVSHSDGHALFAFAEGREIGVDVEAGVRLGDDWPAIARRYFSGREQAELASLPGEIRRQAFLHGWARKEAYLKATGLGIADGLQKIEVNLLPHEAPVFLSEEIAMRWTFVALGEQSPAAALVLERRAEDVAQPAMKELYCEALQID